MSGQQPKAQPIFKQQTMIKQPISQRSTTDICCIFIGLLFTITLIVLSFVLYNADHLNKTSVPSDSSGKMCGIDYPKYSFVYFTNAPDISKRVCVSSCPKAGDIKLDCVPNGNIGCKFNNYAGYQVKYIDTNPVVDANGNICMPTDSTLNQQITDSAKLDNRNLFFKSFNVLVQCLLYSAALSLLFIIFVECFPAVTLTVTIFLSLLVLAGMLVGLFFYSTQFVKTKMIIFIVFLIIFIVIALGTFYHKNLFDLSKVILKESTNFSSESRLTLIYIPICFAFLIGFIMLIIIPQYRAFLSYGTVSFDAKQSLFYEVNKKTSLITLAVLLIQFIWGLSFIKEVFNFCLSAHAINYYFNKGNGICAIYENLKLCFTTHLGSVIASAFVNGFFFPLDVITDCFKICLGDLNTPTLDLVRTDALGFVYLQGSPYCNSAKYCEYLVQESFICEGNFAIMRSYRIAAHILIAGIVSILGLYMKGAVEPYIICAIVVLSIFISTFFISYHADASEGVMLMFLLEEEYQSREEKKAQIDMNNEQNKISYIKQLEALYKKNKEFSKDIKDIKQKQWNLQLDDHIQPKKQPIA